MAAVLFILLGIGLYNRWFLDTSPQSPPAEISVKSRTDTMGAAPSSPIGDQKKEEAIASPGKDDDAEVARVNEQDEPRQAPGSSSGSGAFRSEPDTFPGVLIEGKAADDLADQRQAFSESADAMKSVAKQMASSQHVGRKGNLLVFLHESPARLQTANSSEVPFTLEQVDSLFHLTLVVQRDQRHDDASVEVDMPSPDSLLVRFGQKIIAIQIPVEFRGRIAK
jgi:hypothetical protein